MDWSQRNNLIAAVLPPNSTEIELKLSSFPSYFISRPANSSRQVASRQVRLLTPFSLLDCICSDADLIAIFDPTLNTGFPAANQVVYSVIDTAIGHGSGRVISNLKWDQQTGRYLAAVDDLNTVSIWEMGETIQNWKLVEKVSLRMPFVLFTWFQLDVEEDYSCAQGREITILPRSGPSFLYHPVSFFTLMDNGLISYWFYNEDRVLTQQIGRIAIQGPKVNGADALIHKQDGILYALLLSTGLQIVEVLTAPGTGVIAINQQSMIATEEEPGSLVAWVDESNLVFSGAKGRMLFLFGKNEQNAWVIKNSINCDQVSCICRVQEKAVFRSQIILVGYISGKTEYLSVPALQKTSVEGAILRDNDEGSFAAQEQDLSSFLESTIPEDSHSSVPVAVKSSSNGLLHASLEIGTLESRALISIKVPKFISDLKGNPDDIDKIATVLVTLFMNGKDLQDVKSFLLPVISEELESAFCQVVLSKYFLLKGFTGSPSELILSSSHPTKNLSVLLHFVLSGNQNSKLYRNFCLLLQLKFAKDLFLRAVPNAFQTNDILEVLLGNQSSAIHSVIGNIRFRPGAVHHLGGLVLWILDFCCVVFRNLLCLPADSLKGNCYFFIIDRAVRKIWIELLIFTKAFFFELRQHSDPSKPESMYIVLLEEFLNNGNQLKLDALLGFLVDIANNFDSKVDQSLIPENERLLLCLGSFHESYSEIIAVLQSSLDSCASKLFPLASTGLQHTNTTFNSIALFDTFRSHIGSSLDIILKTNPSNACVKTRCSRCQSLTQTSIASDESIHMFQVYPAWKDSYQDVCLCGGKWVLR